MALRQWRFSELDERKIHSLVYSVWSRIENSVEGTVGVEANAGVKQSLEPRYMGSIPGKLMFRHSEASHIAEALTVGLELCLDNDSEAPQVVRCGLVTSVLAPQCSKGPRQPMLSQKSGTPGSDARCRPVFWTLKFFFNVNTFSVNTWSWCTWHTLSSCHMWLNKWIRWHPNWFALSLVKQVHCLSWACLSQKYQKYCKFLFFSFLSLWTDSGLWTYSVVHGLKVVFYFDALYMQM